MISELQYAGFTHQHTPLELREGVARAASASDGLRRALRAQGEFVVLSTCARFELYTHPVKARPRSWSAWLARQLGFKHAVLASVMKTMTGAGAARHLLRVAAGLDSQILGEDQIQAQVREAFRQAQQNQTCGPLLSALWRAAICTGRRVRSETAISRTAASYATFAANHICRSVQLDRAINVVVCGTGAMAREAVGALAQRDVQRIAIVSRSLARARKLADPLQCQALDLSQLPAAIRWSNALLTCTRSPDYVITPPLLKKLTRPLCLVDLGVPRNVDPEIGQLPGVDLANLDDLAPCVAIRAGVLRQAAGIVEKELHRLCRHSLRLTGGSCPSSMHLSEQELAA